MSTTAVQGPDDVLEVVLGVDTHLDIHVAAVLDQLSRPLGELAVPTTKRGYHSLLAWAEGFGLVRCAGVEGTSSYGAGLTRHLKTARGSWWWKFRGPSAVISGVTASPTPSMLRPPRGGCWLARRKECPQAQTDAWR